MLTRQYATLLASLMIVGGCGEKSAAPPAAPTSVVPPPVQATAPTAAAVSPPVVAPAPPAVSPPPPQIASPAVPDANTPAAAYKLIDSNLNLLYIYYAFSGMPIDYEAIATESSQEYRSTSDGFKRQEIMAALKPKIDTQLQEVKTGRYFTVKTNDRALGHYNFDSKSFPVRGITESQYLTYSDIANHASQVKASLSNSAIFMNYKEENIDKAKALEARVAQGKAAGPSKLYLFVRDTESASGKLINFEILRIEIQDRDGKVFASF